MSLLYSPINMSPANSTIDAGLANDFTLTIRGTKCVGYQLKIYNNATGATVYNPEKEDISSDPLYDNDTLTITVPFTSGMANGNQYKWSIDLYYDGSNFITSREVVFNAYSTPTLSLSVASTLAVQSYEFVPTYTQDEDVPIASFEAKLYDASGKSLRSSGTIYSANIRYTFDGFQSGNSYSVKFTAANQADVIVESNLETFAISYSKPSLSITPTVVNSSDTACIYVNWGGAYQNSGSSTGAIEYVTNHIGGKFLKTYEGSTVYWDLNIPEEFTGTFVFAPDIPILDKLYICNNEDSMLYGVDMDTLSLIGDGVEAPEGWPQGIGGIRNRVYTNSFFEGKIFELDVETMANLSGAGVDAPGGSYCGGIGGIDDRLYYSDLNVDLKLFELDPDTLANLSGSGVTSPCTQPVGIGGTATRLYHADGVDQKIYELDPDTLANISGSGSLMENFWPMGIGGVRDRLYCSGQDNYSMGERLYACDGFEGKLYEIDKDTFANLSGAGVNSPGSSPDSIDGMASRLYISDNGKLYEVDPDTLANLSGSGVTPTFTPTGIGGTATGLYACDFLAQKLFKLDPDTLANLSGAGVSTTFYPSDIGGLGSDLVGCDSVNGKIFNIDPDTLACGTGHNAPMNTVEGIGGIYNRLYLTTPFQGMVEQSYWELDSWDFSVLNGPVIAFTDTPTGIGGIKGSGFTSRVYELDPDSLDILNEVVTPLSSPIDIGGAKGWSYSSALLYPIFGFVNSETSEYLRISFKTDGVKDYFYVQFNGHSILFDLFDTIAQDRGVYFIAITPTYTKIKQWLYTA